MMEGPPPIVFLGNFVYEQFLHFHINKQSQNTGYCSFMQLGFNLSNRATDTWVQFNIDLFWDTQKYL
jgi:hypothetical protein